MLNLRGSTDSDSAKPRDASPERARENMETFARRQRNSALLVAAGVVLGGGILWLGNWADSVSLLLLGGVLLVVLTLIGAAGRGTCPACGGGFNIPEDESGSWNHCFSCGVRLR